MPDPTLSEALREAYASAPVNQVIHHTLELWHPVFSQPIRVVRDVTALDARIEAGAVRDAGLLVTFLPYAFEVVAPEVFADALPQMTTEIDNVGSEILAQVDAAVMAGDPVEAIYRQYLSDTVDEGPENDPPLRMTLLRISATTTRIRAVAGFPVLMDRKFPKLEYELETFPGLAP